MAYSEVAADYVQDELFTTTEINKFLGNIIYNYDTLHASQGSTLTISSGTITVGDKGYYKVEGESSADDTLVTISGGSSGAIIVLSPYDTDHELTIDHGAGNIQTASGLDKVLFDTDCFIQLMYDGTNWREIGSNVRLIRPGFILGNGSVIVAEDSYADYPGIPVFYLTAIEAEADASGSLDMDIFADASGSEPTTKVADFSLSSQQRKTDTTLSGITREHGAKTWRLKAMGDATTITQISVVLHGWTR